MARTAIIIAFVALACVAVANAQCIECKDCKGSAPCLSMCKNSCAPTVNVEACKAYGTKAGQEASSFACELTNKYCGNLVAPRSAPGQQVSLQQCGNAAYGVCQAYGFDPNKSPCGRNFNGVAKCSKSEFRKFYDAIINDECNKKASVFEKAQPQGRRLF